MKNKLWPIFWGIFFVLLGIGYGGDILGAWEFTIFFTGWWTLFIIVPSLISLIQKGYSTSEFIALSVGIVFFLGTRDILNLSIVGKLIFPIILVLIGISILFNDVIKKKINKNIRYKGNPDEQYSIFASKRQNVNGPYLGSVVTAVFGGYKLDLSNAVIQEDIIIKATAIFGGVTIIVPEGVLIQTSTVPIFGNVSNKVKETNEVNKCVILIKSVCMFGGVDIR